MPLTPKPICERLWTLPIDRIVHRSITNTDRAISVGCDMVSDVKKPIGTWMFSIGIVLWAGIIGSTVEVVLHSLLNASEGQLFASVIGWISWIDVFSEVVAISGGVAVAARRYLLPTSTTTIAILVALIYLIPGALYLIALPIAFGSDDLFALFSVPRSVALGTNALLAGATTFLSMRKFSKSSGATTRRGTL